MKVPFVPYSWHHLMLVFLFNFNHSIQCVVFHLTLTCIPVMTHEVEHLSTQSFVICTLLWSKCSYVCCPFFKGIIYIIDLEDYLNVLNTSQVHTLYFLIIYALPVYFLNTDFFLIKDVYTVKYTIFSDGFLIFDKCKQLHHNT